MRHSKCTKWLYRNGWEARVWAGIPKIISNSERARVRRYYHQKPKVELILLALPDALLKEARNTMAFLSFCPSISH